MDDADKKAAEQQYAVTAFDYESNPIGSRDWALYLRGFQAACEWRDSQVGEPVALNIIRKWPDGFEARLQHVWLDVISFIPNVKLYDLQRVLDEFGYTMKIYEGSAPGQRSLTITDLHADVIQNLVQSIFELIEHFERVDMPITSKSVIERAIKAASAAKEQS